MANKKIEVKKKFQFIFPVNEKYLEIDRDFVWTGLAQYGFLVQDPTGNFANEYTVNYDERVIYDTPNNAIVLLPNFFDFQLYVNDRKLFSHPINFRAIPSIEHMLKLPCEYYLPKGTKIFCNVPFVGSYFDANSTPPDFVLKDDDAFQRRNITLFLDGYEVDTIDRETVATLPKPYIYVVGGYFGLSYANYASNGNATYPFASFVNDIVAATGIVWPRANDEQFTLASQVLTADKDNPLPVKYERDCLITKIWRHDWQFFIPNNDHNVVFRTFESCINDFLQTFPYLPTKAIGDYDIAIGNDITQDIIRAAPCYWWVLNAQQMVLNHLMQYLRVQKRDMRNYIYQRDRNIKEVLNAIHIPTCHEPRDIVPLRKKMSDSDIWNLRMNYDEFVDNDGTEIGNVIVRAGGLTSRIDTTNFTYAKRLILIGVKEFANE